MKTRIVFVFSKFTLFVLPAVLISSAIYVTPVHAAGIVVNNSMDVASNEMFT